MRHRRVLLLLIVAGCAGQLETPTVEAVPGRDDVTVRGYRARVAGGLSDELAFDLPGGTRAALIEIDGAAGQFKLAELATPAGVDVVESGGFVTRDAREVDGLVDWLYPNSPSLTLTPGRHRLRFTALQLHGGVAPDEEVTVRLYTRDGAAAGGRIALDFFVADDAVDGDPAPLADALVVALGRLLARAGLGISDYTVANVHADAAVTTGALRAAGARAQALHVVIVRAIDDGSGGTIAGYSRGLPGPFAADRPNAAVLISSEPFASATGTLDVAALAVTCAHEIGHYLGLYHTSERDGRQHDPIADTPECAPGQSPCPDADNVMFWTGGGARSTLTTGQSFIMRLHPLVQPATPPTPPTADCARRCAPPETCVVLGGVSRCAVACDPRGDPCAVGACRRSDDGTFACTGG